MELQLGYTDEEQEFQNLVATADVSVMPPTVTANTVRGKDDWDYVDGGISLTYSVSDDWNIYGSIATSTKPGTLETITGDVFSAGPGSPIIPDQRISFQGAAGPAPKQRAAAAHQA